MQNLVQKTLKSISSMDFTNIESGNPMISAKFTGILRFGSEKTFVLTGNMRVSRGGG